MYIVTSAFVFIFAVSVDIFACGFAYGAGGLHVPFRKLLLINIIGTVMVGTGLFVGYFMSFWVSQSLSMWLGFGIFMVLGLGKLIQWLLNRRKKNRSVSVITWREAVALGFLLSVDGMAAGVGASMSYISLVFIAIVLGVTLFSDMLLFMAGQKLGQKVVKKANLDLGWLSGFVLLVIGVLHLVI